MPLKVNPDARLCNCEPDRSPHSKAQRLLLDCPSGPLFASYASIALASRSSSSSSGEPECQSASLAARLTSSVNIRSLHPTGTARRGRAGG